MLIDSARSSSGLLYALRGGYDILQQQWVSLLAVHQPISGTDSRGGTDTSLEPSFGPAFFFDHLSDRCQRDRCIFDSRPDPKQKSFTKLVSLFSYK